jgi:aminoglycoside phosphotransferase (APT) family kinase protein
MSHESVAGLPEQHELPGIDYNGVSAWFARTLGVDSALSFRLIAGGQSNLTYQVSSADGRSWALRRPPTGSLRPTAHDMGREWRILSGLRQTDVPVPVPAGYCADPSVTGAPFYAMDFVPDPVMDGAAAIERMSAEARERFCESLIETLARIHRVDYAAVGLADLERPEPFVPRQLRRWRQQLSGSDGSVSELLLRVYWLLSARIPAERHRGLAHGDYRPGNVMFRADGTIKAVLDWELCSVGHVMADVGWLSAWWSGGDTVGWSPTAFPGFDSGDSLIERYVAASGWPVEDIAFYEAFALWRLACISQGVYERYRDGAMASRAERLDELRQRPTALAELAMSRLTGSG